MVNMENYEEYMLLYADRELNPEQEQALLAFVQQHPELKAELAAYAATRLQPDEELVFTGKDALIKTEPGGRTMWLGGWKAYAAAASVILFIVLFSINRHSMEELQPVVVKNETITPPVTTAQSENTSFVDKPQSQAGNNADEKAAKPASPLGVKGKELHSKQPVNTVAVKTILPVAKEQPVREQQEIEQTTAPGPHIAEEVVAKSVTKDTAEHVAEAITPQKKTITEHQETQVTPKPADKKNNFIAAVLGEKPAGLEVLQEEVNEKITAAKTIKEQIKNTDAELSFRIGKKELFTVRL